MHGVEAVEEVDVDGGREKKCREVDAPNQVEQIEKRNRAQHVVRVHLGKTASVLKVRQYKKIIN